MPADSMFTAYARRWSVGVLVLPATGELGARELAQLPSDSMSADQADVYLAIKFHADHRNRELVDRISAIFDEHGMTTVCAARDFEEWGQVSLAAQDLMQTSFHAIRNCAAVVVEFSEKGVGLGIEVGYASALDTPVFVLLRPSAQLSTTLEGASTNVFRYSDDQSLSDAARCIAEDTCRMPTRS